MWLPQTLSSVSKHHGPVEQGWVCSRHAWEVKPQLGHLSAMWPWERCLTCLSTSFLIGRDNNPALIRLLKITWVNESFKSLVCCRHSTNTSLLYTLVWQHSAIVTPVSLSVLCLFIPFVSVYSIHVECQLCASTAWGTGETVIKISLSAFQILPGMIAQCASAIKCWGHPHRPGQGVKKHLGKEWHLSHDLQDE